MNNSEEQTLAYAGGAAGIGFFTELMTFTSIFAYFLGTSDDYAERLEIFAADTSFYLFDSFATMASSVIRIALAAEGMATYIERNNTLGIE